MGKADHGAHGTDGNGHGSGGIFDASGNRDELRTAMDRRVDQSIAAMDKQFDGLLEHLGRQFAGLHEHMDRQFAESRAHMDKQFAGFGVGVHQAMAASTASLRRWMIGLWLVQMLVYAVLWLSGAGGMRV